MHERGTAAHRHPLYPQAPAEPVVRKAATWEFPTGLNYSMAFDCGYLKETVGEALARGCAATVTAEPNDPVEYLGRWLLRCGPATCGLSAAARLGCLRL